MQTYPKIYGIPPNKTTWTLVGLLNAALACTTFHSIIIQCKLYNVECIFSNTANYIYYAIFKKSFEGKLTFLVLEEEE